MSALDSLDGVQRWVDKDRDARAVVTALEQAIREMRLTPAEVRSLAHYAAFRVEMYALRPFVVGRDAAESLFSRTGVESVERDRRRREFAEQAAAYAQGLEDAAKLVASAGYDILAGRIRQLHSTLGERGAAHVEEAHPRTPDLPGSFKPDP